VCTYAAPFGVVPIELDEVYPLSQYEIATPPDTETMNYTARQVANYIASTSYKEIILLQDVETWKKTIATACRRACRKKKIPLTLFGMKKLWNENTLDTIMIVIQKVLA